MGGYTAALPPTSPNDGSKRTTRRPKFRKVPHDPSRPRRCTTRLQASSPSNMLASRDSVRRTGPRLRTFGTVGLCARKFVVRSTRPHSVRVATTSSIASWGKERSRASPGARGMVSTGGAGMDPPSNGTAGPPSRRAPCPRRATAAHGWHQLHAACTGTGVPSRGNGGSTWAERGFACQDGMHAGA